MFPNDRIFQQNFLVIENVLAPPPPAIDFFAAAAAAAIATRLYALVKILTLILMYGW
jgi:hypothetical protein